MTDWSDPDTFKRAAKATLSVAATLKRLKTIFRGRRRSLPPADQLKIQMLLFTALADQNESIKHLFKVIGLLSQYVEAKQAEAESIGELLRVHGECLTGVTSDVEALADRVSKLDGTRARHGKKSKKGRKGRG